ncbi:MAG: extracellular solute-binding protein [Bacillota bacterium]
MVKRLLSTLLSAALIASFMSGCTSGGTDTPANNSKTSETTLTLWSIATESDAFSNAYNKAIKDFETANPGVKIVHETFENEAYKTKIKTAVSSNNLPDLFYTWGGGFSKPFVESGKVLAIDKYYTGEYKEQLSEAALTYATYNGKIYGSTYTTPVSALFYNKKIFDENGLKAPATFDELIQVCEKLIQKGITPIGISGKDTWVLAMTHDALTLKSAGPKKVKEALKKEGQSYDDPDFLESAKKFRQLVEMGAFHKGATGLSNDEASALFYSGKVAMYTTGSWMAGSIQTDPENPADFDVVPFPVVGSNAKATDFMGGAVDTIMVSASTKNPDLAGKAAFELTRSISKYSYLDGAGLAVWKKDYDDSKVNPITKKLADYAANATSFTLWFDTMMEAEDAGEYLTLLQEMYVGNITPEDFVKSMKKNLE